MRIKHLRMFCIKDEDTAEFYDVLRRQQEFRISGPLLLRFAEREWLESYHWQPINWEIYRG